MIILTIDLTSIWVVFMICITILLVIGAILHYKGIMESKHIKTEEDSLEKFRDYLEQTSNNTDGKLKCCYYKTCRCCYVKSNKCNFITELEECKNILLDEIRKLSDSKNESMPPKTEENRSEGKVEE